MTASIETERLILRQWKPSDYKPFARMNADPEATEFDPVVFTEQESNRTADSVAAMIDQRGWGFWALEEKTSGQFAGLTGLFEPTPDLPFAPCVGVGWRLARPFWGKGYATEAARASVQYGFEKLALDFIVAFTMETNERSRSVMERIGMRDAQQDFLFPGQPADSPYSRYVLYRITYADWMHQHDSARHE